MKRFGYIPNQLQNAMRSPEGSVQTLPFGINRGKGFARPRDDLKSKQFSTMLAFWRNLGIYGFAKNKRENITPKEKETASNLAQANAINLYSQVKELNFAQVAQEFAGKV